MGKKNDIEHLTSAVADLTRVLASLQERITRLEQEILPQDPDPEIGLP